MNVKTVWRAMEGIILFCAFVLTNQRCLGVSRFHFPLDFFWLGSRVNEEILWVLIIALAMLILHRTQTLSTYWSAWRRNWIIIPFIGLALCSQFWSAAPETTLYRSSMLLASTIIGAYIGVRYSVPGVMKILFRAGFVLILLCSIMIGFSPKSSIMPGGAWEGIFWHRNHMGSIMAFFHGFYLLYLIVGVQKREPANWMALMFCLLSLFLAIESHSATAAIILLVLDGFIIVGAVWLRIRLSIRKNHYLIFAGCAAVGIIACLSNLDFVFGLFDRSPTMTGRIPMWSYVLTTFVAERPIFGHGFGAMWSLDWFQVNVQKAVRWGYPVVIGDNGFLDILLHLGVVGLTAFLLVLGNMIVRSVRFILSKPALSSFFPLLVMVYAVAGNISFSLFFETEEFVGMIMAAAWFSTVGDLFGSKDGGTGRLRYIFNKGMAPEVISTNPAKLDVRIERTGL